MELESTSVTSIRNIKKFAQYYKCRLRQKRRFRRKSYGNKDTKQEIDIYNRLDQTTPINYQKEIDEEEFESLENNIDVENQILTFEIIVENVENENDIDASQLNSEYPEYEIEYVDEDTAINENDSECFEEETAVNENYSECIEEETVVNENYSEYTAEEETTVNENDSECIEEETTVNKNDSECDDDDAIRENEIIFHNKSEINEKTEHEWQAYGEFKIVKDSNENEEIIKHAEILEVNNETALSETIDDFKIIILENVLIKHATCNSNDELLQASDDIVFKEANNNSNIEIINVNTHEFEVIKNNNETINDVEYIVYEVNDGFVLQTANEDLEDEQIINISPERIETMTEITSNTTEDTETVNLSDKSDKENIEKVPSFDNFKMPKEVTQTKKKIVLKKQPQFILTHVVGGHIIQESNYAFPIRQPQKQKTTTGNSNIEETVRTEVKKEEGIVEEENGTEETTPTAVFAEAKIVEQEYRTEDHTPTEIKEDKQIVDKDIKTEVYTPTELNKDEQIVEEENGTETTLSEVIKKETIAKEKPTPTEEPDPREVKDKEKIVEEECNEKGSAPTEGKEEENELEKEVVPYGEMNPFARLQQSTVEAWTAEELSDHLLKFCWEDTASVLQDNEIDGASLFLVTKAQLMIIGVDEDQADVISNFIQSASSKGN